MANTTVNYEMTFIDTVSSLAPINPQLIFTNSEDKKTVSIKANNSSRTVLYTLDAPSSMFNFTGNSMAMINYNKFKQYFGTYCTKNAEDKPELSTEQDDLGQPRFIFIKNNTIASEIRHHLASIDTVEKPCFNEVDAGNIDAAFALSDAQISNLKKMISMVEADSIKFSVNGSIVKVTLFNKLTADVFTQDYNLDAAAVTAFDLTTPASGFELLPVAGYKVSINKDGLLHLHQDRDDGIELNLYIAEQG